MRERDKQGAKEGDTSGSIGYGRAEPTPIDLLLHIAPAFKTAGNPHRVLLLPEIALGGH